MLNILQARLQQYMNCKLPDVQVGFRKGKGARDQIANIRWIIEIAREFQKNIYFCFNDYAKAFDYVDHNCGTFLKRQEYHTKSDLPPKKSVCRSRSNNLNRTWNNGLVPNQERSTSKLCIITLLI